MSDQNSRQWKLVRLLSGSVGRTLAQLQAELGVSKRTVQRDLKDLTLGGLPVISYPRNGTIFWRFIDGFSAYSPVSLEINELMALYFSRGLLKPLQGSAVYDAVESALAKIGSAIPAQGHNFIRTVEEGIAVSNFGWKDYRRSRDTLAALTRAVYNQFTVVMQHTAAGKAAPLERRVDPYKLWYANGGLYLVGWDHTREQFLVFAVERIRAASVTNQRFTHRKDFDFEALCSSAFNMIWGEPQKVRIRFSPEQAFYVKERTWHPSQKITPQSDGGVVLELDVADLGEVRRWLVGWGADAEVLEPGSLRKDIAEIGQALAARAGSSASS